MVEVTETEKNKQMKEPEEKGVYQMKAGAGAMLLIGTIFGGGACWGGAGGATHGGKAITLEGGGGGAATGGAGGAILAVWGADLSFK